MSGYEVCHTLRSEFGPELPIMFLSGSRTESYDRVAGLLLGADDYVVKPYAEGELITRLTNLYRRSRTRALGEARRLTKRELEVLELLGEGLRHEDIARQLFISPKTVATHVEHILRKLGVRSRAEAIAVAYREEILQPHTTPESHRGHPPPGAALAARRTAAPERPRQRAEQTRGPAARGSRARPAGTRATRR